MQPDEIDPSTIKVGDPREVKDTLEGTAQLIKKAAVTGNKYVLASYDDDSNQIRIQSLDPIKYDNGYFLCPRAADIEYEKDGINRGFGSMLATPAGELVVAKPSLCDSCVHNLSRKVTGDCTGRKFTRLIGLI